MADLRPVYLTSMGVFLPNAPVDNDRIETILGSVGGQASRLRRRILKSNGIEQRHYALDEQQQTTHQNSEMAARAVQACLDRGPVSAEDIQMLAVATTQGDLPLPGLASMVQAEVGIPPCEILSTHGVCSAGVMALKAAFNELRVGDKRHAVVCASELASRLLKKSRYEAVGTNTLDFEAEFLRWMLSDGAGAALLQTIPRGLSLRLDWIEIISYADSYDVCMSCGTSEPKSWSRFADNGRRVSWQDYPTYADAERDGALLIRQDLGLLENIVRVGVDGFLRLIQQGRVDPQKIDHMLCHYSSHYFRGKIVELLRMAGCMVPEEKWFTNLYTKGNTGCAAIFIMLEELFYSGRLQPGQTVFCVVPESGRFTTAYVNMTVVEGGR